MDRKKLEKAQKKEAAEKQLQEIGYVSLKNRYTKEQIFDAMAASGGVTGRCCRILDCMPWEFQVLIQADKELGKRWRAVRRHIVADAEQTMVDLMGAQSDAKTRFAAAKFLLQQLGRQDGYGPDSQVAVEVNSADGDKMTQVRAIFGINE